MSALIVLLLLPVIFLSFRIILTLTGWLVWLLCLAAMIAVVVGLIVWGMDSLPFPY